MTGLWSATTGGDMQMPSQPAATGNLFRGPPDSSTEPAEGDVRTKCKCVCLCWGM